MLYLVILVSVVQYAVGDTPPIPYAAAAANAAPSPSFPTSYAAHEEDLPPVSGPYVQHFSHGPEGFNVQSGYEGYLVPSPAAAQKTTIFVPIQHGLQYISSTTGIASLLKYIATKGFHIIPKVALAVVGVAALFLVGCFITTAVCTFTPFCNISFAGWGVARESMRSYLTEDRISATAAFVTEAIKKYKEMYANEAKKTGNSNANH